MSFARALRPFIINTFLALVSLSVCLAVLEVVARVSIPSWYPRYAFTADPVAGYVNTPNQTLRWNGAEYDFETTTNSYGFRDEPLDDDGRKRILAVGDSFAWGFGVDYDQTYLALLEREAGTRIIKTGVCGYGTWHAAKIFEKYGRDLKPDVVLLNFFIGNDFYENMGVRNLTISDGRFLEIPPTDASMIHKTITWLRGRVRLVEFVINKIKTAPRLHNLVKKAGLAGDQIIGELDLFSTEQKPQVTEAYQVTRDIIEKLNADVKQIGAKLFVAIIPAKNQIDLRRFEKELGEIKLDADKFDILQPNRQLISMLENMKIEYIDLTPVFSEHRKSEPEQPLYFAIDKHWNSAGHALAASALLNSALRW